MSASLKHLLFVDGVLILCFGNDGEGKIFKDILKIYCATTGMDIMRINLLCSHLSWMTLKI